MAMKLLLAVLGVVGTFGLRVPPESADQQRETAGKEKLHQDDNLEDPSQVDNRFSSKSERGDQGANEEGSGYFKGFDRGGKAKNQITSEKLMGGKTKGDGVGRNADSKGGMYSPMGANRGPYYMSDANHPGHKRVVQWVGSEKVRVTGDDGKGTPEWTVEGVYDDEDGLMSLDFSAQEGPKEIVAGFSGNDDALKFENGMEWQITFSQAADIEGDFSDPNHPGCPRNLKVEGSSRVIFTGADQTEGATKCEEGTTGPKFEIMGHLIGGDIHMDFSPKGGPKDLLGQVAYTGGKRIVWTTPEDADGNGGHEEAGMWTELEGPRAN